MQLNEAISTLVGQQTSLLMLTPSDNPVYYIYSVYDHTGRLVYVNYDLIHDISTFAKLRRNPAFDVSKPYTVIINDNAETVALARAKAHEYRKKLCGLEMPEYNMTAQVNRRSSVKCIETGEVWRTASEACRSLSIPYSNMSNHLARHKGHRSIKGKTFCYVSFYAQDEHGRVIVTEKAKS